MSDDRVPRERHRSIRRAVAAPPRHRPTVPGRIRPGLSSRWIMRSCTATAGPSLAGRRGAAEGRKSRVTWPDGGFHVERRKTSPRAAGVVILVGRRRDHRQCVVPLAAGTGRDAWLRAYSSDPSVPAEDATMWRVRGWTATTWSTRSEQRGRSIEGWADPGRKPLRARPGPIHVTSRADHRGDSIMSHDERAGR